jgi:hypothetical protein
MSNVLVAAVMVASLILSAPSSDVDVHVVEKADVHYVMDDSAEDES